MKTQTIQQHLVDTYRRDLAKATMRKARRFERAAKTAPDDLTRIMYQRFAEVERGTAKTIRQQAG